MASPQTENGFTRIANEIVEAMAKTHLSGRQCQILWVIFRLTYGYNRKEAVISFDLFAEMTGCQDRRHIASDIKTLEKRGIILVNRHQTGNTYSFQKNYELWDNPSSIAENSNTAEVVSIAENGNTSIAEIGNTTDIVSIAENGNTSIAEIGNMSIAEIGTHERKKENKRNMVAGDFLPTAEEQARVLFPGKHQHNGYRQAEQALARSGWTIHNQDLHDAAVYFLAATDIPPPRVKSTRRDWLSSLAEHVEEYGAAMLKELYPVAVEKLRESKIRVGRPGALSKTLPVAAHMLRHPEKPKGYEL